ncbi:MAG: hypothetical protein KatS3mg113_0370 [Planctomycetaceae bacterium]|nr:MAG: hypothetical protein KatS3mg113_0370 [Planctomycetaceae bacterium]
MSWPVRLLHVADAQLDQPPRGLGTIPRELGETLAQASLTTWERIVETAITYQVAGVLLTGNTWVPHEASLAAEVALRQAFERWEEHEITVWITPGPLDPPEAWDQLPELPRTVTVFTALQEDAVELTDHGRTMALLQPVGPWLERPGPCVRQHGSNHPFIVGLWWDTGLLPPEVVPTHLLTPTVDVVCAGQQARTQGWLRPDTPVLRQHAPVAYMPDDTGPRGVTLIEIDPQRRFTARPLPLSLIRREQLRIDVGTARHLDDVCDLMLGAIEQLPSIPGEMVRCIGWSLIGSARQLQPLIGEEHQAQQLLEMLTELTDQPPQLQYIHRLHPWWHSCTDVPPEEGIWRDYLALWEQVRDQRSGDLQRIVEELRPQAQAMPMWERSRPLLEPSQIWQEACDQARRWFAGL